MRYRFRIGAAVARLCRASTIYYSIAEVKTMSELEATEIQPGRYAVRPTGQLGTCGSYPYVWTAVYVNARYPAHAVHKVEAAIRASQKRILMKYASPDDI